MFKNMMLAVVSVISMGSAASAAPIFSDDFEGEALGLNQALDNWTVAPGTIDVIGNGYFDFYPGNGNYLDMNGSTTQEATITTGSLGLVLGQTYRLTFNFGTNNNPGPFPVNLTFGLGSMAETIAMLSQPLPTLASAVYDFVYDGSGDFLYFADTSGTPGDNGGPVIDNVSLSAVPLPAGGLLLIGALGGLVGLRRRKTA